MTRISFRAVAVDQRRGLEEVSVWLDDHGADLTGTARVGRGDTLAAASARATLEALGDLAPAVSGVRVAELRAGPVEVVQVELDTPDGVVDGSCSEGGRELPEAVARAVLDALNPWWGT